MGPEIIFSGLSADCILLKFIIPRVYYYAFYMGFFDIDLLSTSNSINEFPLISDGHCS